MTGPARSHLTPDPEHLRRSTEELQAAGYAVIRPDTLDRLHAFLVAGMTADTAERGQLEYSRAHGVLQAVVCTYVTGRDHWGDDRESGDREPACPDQQPVPDSGAFHLSEAGEPHTGALRAGCHLCSPG